jgi:hypothetical protein
LCYHSMHTLLTVVDPRGGESCSIAEPLRNFCAQRRLPVVAILHPALSGERSRRMPARRFRAVPTSSRNGAVVIACDVEKVVRDAKASSLRIRTAAGRMLVAPPAAK